MKENDGFLKCACEHPNLETIIKTWYKCVNTEEYYTVSNYVFSPRLGGSICSDDPHFYQVCGTRLGGKVTNSELLCEFSLRQDKSDGLMIMSSQSGFEKVPLPSGRLVYPSEICDSRCNLWDCEDEAVCNGYTYGMYCKRGDKIIYVRLRNICDGSLNCDDDEDEANCSVTNTTDMSCRHAKTGYLVPLHNFTRCTSTGLDNLAQYFSQYCGSEDLARQHTNCTDPSRVGLSCDVDGYSSTVSKYFVCNEDKITACDDGIDQLCLSTVSCHVHKHAMCDSIMDCVDLADENHSDCRLRTTTTCKRRVGNVGELPIPISWLKDGVWDCKNGADETADWPMCGQEQTLRFVASNEVECENVFLCTTGNRGYIELHNLCDGLETCGNENAICSVSSRSQSVKTSVFTTNKGLTKRLSYCLEGLSQLQQLKSSCTREQFNFPKGDVLGIKKTWFILPEKAQSCDNMYGEMYLYTSCTDRCINAACPLKTIPRYEVCPNQFPNRIGTLANNEYLIFVTRSFGTIYTNNYFVCDDKIKCIDYSKVCDLVNDCFDNSDEAQCTNHFKCNSGKLLPKTKKCDGHVDCADLSDECNEHCSKQILEGTVLKGISWLIGLLAVVANLVIIGKSLWTLKQCKTVAAVMNRCFIIMIALGDFLIGCYLLIIAIYDTIVFREYYCKRQISWITSYKCSVIGVFSTIGSQISLFSMAGLSIVRIHGIWNSMSIPGEITRVQIIKITTAIAILIFASATIAIVPVLVRYEDFFVNGVKFQDGLKIFIGTSNKDTVRQVIEAYYGRTKDAELKWDTLIQMIQAMFSHDMDYEDLTKSVAKVDFYGNDGVCLFKYFVQENDPQRMFVWSILSLNFICFLFISISYILIGILSRRSAKSLASSQNNQQIADRNRRMNQRITIIITTDFLCWIPFIMTCTLHSLNIINATAWYSIFSMVILPINSVINPFLYDDVVTSRIGAVLHSSSTRISSLFGSLRQRFTPREATELDDFSAQVEDGKRGNKEETGI